ncbi:MAG: hypothetical protein LBT00_04925 [Spirochaetaceae bacterium]|jgi:hypothetical protein|nr:hypothetical protein [Spirochaetaceae bacterium]
MKQNDFRGIAAAVVVFALGIIAVGFTGCDFLEDFVKTQGVEEPLITDSFSGASTGDEVVDSVIDMIRAAKDEPSLTLKLAAREDEPVNVGDSTQDIYEGLVLNSGNSPAEVTIDGGGGGRTIAWSVTVDWNTTPLITVGNGVTLELRNITFQGTPNTTNVTSLIKVAKRRHADHGKRRVSHG